MNLVLILPETTKDNLKIDPVFIRAASKDGLPSNMIFFIIDVFNFSLFSTTF